MTNIRSSMDSLRFGKTKDEKRSKKEIDWEAKEKQSIAKMKEVYEKNCFE